jgi:hypothetical protein
VGQLLRRWCKKAESTAQITKREIKFYNAKRRGGKNEERINVLPVPRCQLGLVPEELDKNHEKPSSTHYTLLLLLPLQPLCSAV